MIFDENTELDVLVDYFRKRMLPVVTQHRLLDIVGTGGDKQNTVNISTGSAILAASCGIKIAKHGNRAVTSMTGSADVLEALGIKIDLTPEKIARCIEEVGIGFCFAPLHHPELVKVKELRKQSSLPTVFNLLGPLVNPAQPEHIILGVYDAAFMEKIAHTLQRLGTTRSLVVHAHGVDEISCVGPATLLDITANQIIKTCIDPQEFGLDYCTIDDLRGGQAHENAQLLLDAFMGKNKAIANTLILNAALALYIYGKYASIKEGIQHAKNNINNGAALSLVTKFRECSHA